MKAVKGTYENGKITLSEPPLESGPMEVLVVFPEAIDDPWENILAETTPRPAFAKFVRVELDAERYAAMLRGVAQDSACEYITEPLLPPAAPTSDIAFTEAG